MSKNVNIHSMKRDGHYVGEVLRRLVNSGDQIYRVGSLDLLQQDGKLRVVAVMFRPNPTCYHIMFRSRAPLGILACQILQQDDFKRPDHGWHKVFWYRNSAYDDVLKNGKLYLTDEEFPKSVWEVDYDFEFYCAGFRYIKKTYPKENIIKKMCEQIKECHASQ